MTAVRRLLPDSLQEAMGSVYTSVYWCIFPPSTQDRVIPRLQDCQDDLCDRLAKLQTRARELDAEIRINQKHRDKNRLRRILLEKRALEKDLAATENTLWTVERQLQLIERSELDGAIIDTLHSASSALSGLASQMPQAAQVDDVTQSLQDRMMTVHEVAEAVDEALTRGLGPSEDDTGLEEELEQLLAADSPKQMPLDSTEMGAPASAPLLQTTSLRPPAMKSNLENATISDLSAMPAPPSSMSLPPIAAPPASRNRQQPLLEAALASAIPM